MVKSTTLVHLSDIHFGCDADLTQIDAVERFVRRRPPDAVVISGDLTQRGRHGELQRALAFRQTLEALAPVLVIPGNHDVAWWTSPFGLFGRESLYTKYRRYFGPDLTPTLKLPDLVIGSALTSFGVAFGSCTWNLNDLAVKGHLPSSEVARLAAVFEGTPPDLLRCAVIHHNLARGAISGRMGLARWRQAQRALLRAGVDLVLCGHDHQEGAVQLAGRMVVATASTLTHRTRGRRPSAFNRITVDAQSIGVEQLRWDREQGDFVDSDLARFARARPAA